MFSKLSLSSFFFATILRVLLHYLRDLPHAETDYLQLNIQLQIATNILLAQTDCDMRFFRLEWKIDFFSKIDVRFSKMENTPRWSFVCYAKLFDVNMRVDIM